MDKLKTIEKETKDLLSKIIDKPEIEINEQDEVFNIVIKAEEEAPVIIGRHGETIKAIQKLLEVILYKKFNESVEILVNVNDYREKQKEKIYQIVEKYVAKTKDTNESSYIKGFSS